MKLRRLAFSTCVVPALGLGIAAAGDASSGGHTLTIYSSLPLQGDSQPQSEDVVRAIEMSLDEHGGRAGNHAIEYVSLDDANVEEGRWNPDQVEANARMAAEDDTAIAYIGEFNSPASRFSIPILNEAGLLQVSPSNTHVGLTRSEGAEPGEPDIYYPTGERTYARVIPTDYVQAPALASYMNDQGCTSVYILNDEETYGAGIADRVETVASEWGLEVLGNDGLGSAATFDDLAERIKTAGADCFLFGGFTQNDAVPVFQAVAAAIPGILMFGPDGIAESAFTNQFEPELWEQIFITNPTLPADQYPESGQAFFEDFEAAYGHQPEPYAIYGYEAMNVVLLAIENAGDQATPDAEGRAAVVEQFFQIEDRESVLGTYSIDENGDTTLSDYGGYTIRDGEVAFLQVISAAPSGP